MSRCVLALYRSAVPNPSVDRGADIIGATRAPGLVLRVSGNPFDDAGRSSVGGHAPG